MEVDDDPVDEYVFPLSTTVSGGGGVGREPPRLGRAAAGAARAIAAMATVEKLHEMRDASAQRHTWLRHVHQKLHTRASSANHELISA